MVDQLIGMYQVRIVAINQIPGYISPVIDGQIVQPATPDGKIWISYKEIVGYLFRVDDDLFNLNKDKEQVL